MKEVIMSTFSEVIEILDKKWSELNKKEKLLTTERLELIKEDQELQNKIVTTEALRGTSWNLVIHESTDNRLVPPSGDLDA